MMSDETERLEDMPLCEADIPEPGASAAKKAAFHWKFYQEVHKFMIVENDRIVIEIPQSSDTHGEWRRINDKTE